MDELKKPESAEGAKASEPAPSAETPSSGTTAPNETSATSVASESTASQPAPPSAETPLPAAAPEPAAPVEPVVPAVAAAVAPPAPAPAAPVEPAAAPPSFPAAYEHPLVIRFCHWLNAVALVIMIGSGLQILDAFTSFGAKVPEKDFVTLPDWVKLGGWLEGGRHWHFTFMWIFAITGIVYVAYQFWSGHYKMVLFTRKDLPGVWPMTRHYFFFGPKPKVTEPYNALQKLAYTVIVLCGAASIVTGIAIYNSVQFSWLVWLLGGFQMARMFHFAAMCGFLAFIPGHLIMVALHGWSNFASMLSGWKKNPEYSSE
jgi:Ni/Fe-hydrogenase b-type cytochrome subunit